ncbi:MAG: cytidylyltransferase domain-containing protein [Chthoniobacterales bacterium]
MSSGVPRMQTVALIPARGGSRRLPGKNLLSFGGLPLIVWTIRAALDAGTFDKILVSSDDAEILRVSREAGAETLQRPPGLALDDTSSMDVVWHACDSLVTNPDILVLLQPTSPLRRASDIRQSLQLLEESGAPAIVSVTDRAKHPEWAYALDGAGRLHARDTHPSDRVVGLNGAIYAAQLPWLRARNEFIGEGTLGYLMPAEFSADIDTLEEFEEAERLIVRP